MAVPPDAYTGDRCTSIIGTKLRKFSPLLTTSRRAAASSRTLVNLVQKQSSILSELGWLGLFFGVFVVLVYLMNIFVVPHHFNDKIAIVIAGFIAALTMIAVRARWQR